MSHNLFDSIFKSQPSTEKMNVLLHSKFTRFREALSKSFNMVTASIDYHFDKTELLIQLPVLVIGITLSVF